MGQDASCPKKWSNVPPKQFFTIFFENTFFEKIVKYKDIQHLICDKKSYIRFWCKMTPYRSYSGHVTKYGLMGATFSRLCPLLQYFVLVLRGLVKNSKYKFSRFLNLPTFRVTLWNRLALAMFVTFYWK